MKNALYGAIGAFLVFLLVALVGARVEISILSKDRDRWRSSAGEYLKAAGAWEASYRSASSTRAQEGREAIRATSLAAQACDARVAAARRSAGAIQTIVTKDPIYDEAHCPVRRSVGFDLLRDATGAAPAR